jgi:hypothetical protein
MKANVNDRVRHIDAAAPGTVVRVLPQRSVRVQWDTGGSSVVRRDLLVPLDAEEANR